MHTQEGAMDERRYFKRIEFHVDVAVIINGEKIAGELIDLALKGALVEFEKELPIHIGEQCWLNLSLLSSDVTLEFQSKIVHHHRTFYGFLFLESDLDSVAHLRRLLVLNTGEEEEIEKELVFWLRT